MAKAKTVSKALTTIEMKESQKDRQIQQPVNMLAVSQDVIHEACCQIVLLVSRQPLHIPKPP